MRWQGDFPLSGMRSVPGLIDPSHIRVLARDIELMTGECRGTVVYSRANIS